MKSVLSLNKASLIQQEQAFKGSWRKLVNFGHIRPYLYHENFLFVNFLYKVIFKLILKMESKIWLDSIKWSKNCHFCFFRQNDENPNFRLWIAKAQIRMGLISYQYYFFHIQSICFKMTFMVFVRFDLREIYMWAPFSLNFIAFGLETQITVFLLILYIYRFRLNVTHRYRFSPSMTVHDRLWSFSFSFLQFLLVWLTLKSFPD